jgi:hypothetical protein
MAFNRSRSRSSSRSDGRGLAGRGIFLRYLNFKDIIEKKASSLSVDERLADGDISAGELFMAGRDLEAVRVRWNPELNVPPAYRCLNVALNGTHGRYFGVISAELRRSRIPGTTVLEACVSRDGSPVVQSAGCRIGVRSSDGSDRRLSLAANFIEAGHMQQHVFGDLREIKAHIHRRGAVSLF